MGNTQIPAVNPYTFPYKRKWSQGQIAELINRSDRLRDLLTDAVGPAGQSMFLPPDLVALISVHLALAGTDTHCDERQYIVAQVGELAPDQVQFENPIKWVLREDYDDAELAESNAAARAHAAKLREQWRTKLTPELRRELAAELFEGLETEAEARKDDRDNSR